MYTSLHYSNSNNIVSGKILNLKFDILPFGFTYRILYDQLLGYTIQNLFPEFFKQLGFPQRRYFTFKETKFVYLTSYKWVKSFSNPTYICAYVVLCILLGNSRYSFMANTSAIDKFDKYANNGVHTSLIREM